jgi:tankyrase
MLIDLSTDDAEHIAVEEQMQSSIREHKDNCGGNFIRYNVLKVCSYKYCDSV